MRAVRVHTKRTPVSAAELRSRLDWFEQRYGTPSNRLVDAFRVDGVLHETEDFTTWSQTYTAWKLVGRPPVA